MTENALNQQQATKLWATQLIAGNGLRNSFIWEKLLKFIEELKTNNTNRNDIDIEALASIILVTTIIGPLVFQNTVGDGSNSEELAKRYSDELQKLLNAGAFSYGNIEAQEKEKSRK